METQARIRDLFAQAVDLPSEGREEFVRKACGDDVAVREAVESLLHAHAIAGDFLADPVIDPARLAAPDAVAAGAPTGPYHIVKLLGEGGYGSVFLAEQQTPLRRQVALKILKPMLDSPAFLARFQAERQALALMEHPHIARIFDAGTTGAGRPYFVMEYVDGPPITIFCTSAHLSIRDRLTLFAKVCMAVQHAHQKGIIHRDLKPANVLIAVQDGVPVPKIIDFGIAKSIEVQLTEHTGLTSHGQFLGTPQYMSPEQAGSAHDLDTRTDIYALGAILYELLTGTPAFDLAQLRAAAADELQRIIREVDPPRPSTRLRTLGNTSSVRRPHEARAARKTAQLLRGELDWIVMRSMEKDRARRYETAESFAGDIHRYLADVPVFAGPPSRIYRLSKFVRRHRILIAAGVTVLLALVACLAIASTALVRANRERHLALLAQADEATARRQAQQQRTAAEVSAALAQAQARKLLAAQTFLYQLLSPGLTGGSLEPPPRAVLDYAAHRIGDPSLVGHPEVEGPIRAALGNGYLQHGRVAEAYRQYRAAIDAFRQTTHGDDPNLASAMNNTAVTLLMQGKFDEAEPLVREALAMYRRMNHGDNAIDAPALRALAAVLAHQAHNEEAGQLLESVLIYVRSGYGDESPIVAGVLEQLADVLESQGRHDAAVERRREAVAIRPRQGTR